MGTVYLAHDDQLDRPVALKVPHVTPDEGAEILARFAVEARAAATLVHPNICPVYDVGAIDGVHYLAMAYIEGRPLTALVRTPPTLPPRAAVALVCGLSRALQEAHQRGIVHRDLKPANILLNHREEPVILDFGMARRSRPGEERLTRDGQVIGTPCYMPPEQVVGDAARMGPASDVYSLGVILYELLTGTVPYQGSVGEVLAKVLTEAPPPPRARRPDLDPALEAVCLRAMAKSVEDRYPTMSAFADALTAFLQPEPAVGRGTPDPVASGAGTSVRPALPPAAIPSTRRRLFRRLVPVLVGTGLLAVAGLLTVRPFGPAPPSRPALALAGRPQPLFDGVSLPVPAWRISEGAWGAEVDDEGSRVLAGQGVIRRQLPVSGDFALDLAVNLHQAEAVEVHFGIARAGGGLSLRPVLRLQRDGVSLGRREGDRGTWQPLSALLPAPGAVGPDGGARYQDLRLLRAGEHWWAYWNGKSFGSLADDDQPELSEFRLVTEGGVALFEALEVDELVRR